MTTLSKMVLSMIASSALVACGQAEADKTTDMSEPLVAPSEALASMGGFAGDYVIVDMRRASDVAAPGQPGMMSDGPVGQTVGFTRDGIEMEGLGCDDWRIDPMDTTPDFIQSDPNLTDLTLGPTDAPKSRGDQRDFASFSVTCEGETFATLHKVDDRVLVWPIENSTLNLILEKPLTPVKIKAYQVQLKSMKFYDGALTGVLDAETLAASRRWYEYRAELGDGQPIPARPAITENLLDTLRVLSP